MTGLQSGTHRLHIADALKSVVQAAVCQLYQDLLDWPVWIIFGIHEASATKFFSNLKLGGVDVNADDVFGTSLLSSVGCGQPHSSQAKNGHRCVFFNIGGVQRGTISSGDLCKNKPI